MRKYLMVLLSICMMALVTGCGEQQQAVDTGEAAEEIVEDEEREAESAAETLQELPEEVYDSDDNEEEIQEQVNGSPSHTEDATGAIAEDVWDALPQGRRLTPDELQEYTEWAQERENYGFLLSHWDNPTEIDLMQVFYSGAGISRQGTEEEIQAFLTRYGQEELYTDFFAMDKGAVSEFLNRKVGLNYDEILAKGNRSLETVYYPETESFCFETGDTNYCMFECIAGVENGEGTRVTLFFQGYSWETQCITEVSNNDLRMITYNHVQEGMALDGEPASGSGADTGCLIDQTVLDQLRMDADASAVMNQYVLGDWSKITKEALQGIWYCHPGDVGDNKEYDVVLQFEGDEAVVYYPAVGFYGDARYEWDVIDRSDRGLSPELAIYWNGTKEGELAWYILGISDERDYFWCNGEVFYRQKNAE